MAVDPKNLRHTPAEIRAFTAQAIDAQRGLMRKASRVFASLSREEQARGREMFEAVIKMGEDNIAQMETLLRQIDN